MQMQIQMERQTQAPAKAFAVRDSRNFHMPAPRSMGDMRDLNDMEGGWAEKIVEEVKEGDDVDEVKEDRELDKLRRERAEVRRKEKEELVKRRKKKQERELYDEDGFLRSG
jgi:hypothetical protein